MHPMTLQSRWFCPHFIDKEADTQADEMICPRSHSLDIIMILSLSLSSPSTFLSLSFISHSKASYCSEDKDKTTSTPGSGTTTLFTLISQYALPLPTPGPSDSAFLVVLHSLKPLGLCTHPVPGTLFPSLPVTPPLLRIAVRVSHLQRGPL